MSESEGEARNVLLWFNADAEGHMMGTFRTFCGERLAVLLYAGASDRHGYPGRFRGAGVL